MTDKQHSNEIQVYIEKCRKEAVMPSYARAGDAGMDVCAAEDTKVNPGESKIIWTGLKFAVPQEFEIQVRPRSGLSLNTPLRISNSPGTIDSGYRGELGIIITNTSAFLSPDNQNSEPYTIDIKGNKQGTYLIRVGDRIAQLVLSRVPRMKLVETGDVGSIGSDRGGGFGSTGV